MSYSNTSIEELRKDPVKFKKTVIANVFIQTFKKMMPLNSLTLARMKKEMSDEMAMYFEVANMIIDNDPLLSNRLILDFSIRHAELVQKTIKHIDSRKESE